MRSSTGWQRCNAKDEDSRRTAKQIGGYALAPKWPEAYNESTAMAWGKSAMASMTLPVPRYAIPQNRSLPHCSSRRPVWQASFN